MDLGSARDSRAGFGDSPKRSLETFQFRYRRADILLPASLDFVMPSPSPDWDDVDGQIETHSHHSLLSNGKGEMASFH